MSLDHPFVLSFDAAERKRGECVGRALEQLSGELFSGTEPLFDADDKGEDTFVDVVGCGQRDEGAGSEDFTLVDALMRANLLSETVLAGVVRSSELPLCWFFILICVSFFYRNNTVAPQIFHKLVHSPRSNTKMASWGQCVLVLGSTVEPAAPPGDAFACVLGGSGSDFEVGR